MHAVCHCDLSFMPFSGFNTLVDKYNSIRKVWGSMNYVRDYHRCTFVEKAFREIWYRVRYRRSEAHLHYISVSPHSR